MNTPVNDAIKDSADTALRWMQDEAQAYANAALWLDQAANGEVPHGGITYEPKEKPSEQSPA